MYVVLIYYVIQYVRLIGVFICELTVMRVGGLFEGLELVVICGLSGLGRVFRSRGEVVVISGWTTLVWIDIPGLILILELYS